MWSTLCDSIVIWFNPNRFFRNRDGQKKGCNHIQLYEVISIWNDLWLVQAPVTLCDVTLDRTAWHSRAQWAPCVSTSECHYWHWLIKSLFGLTEKHIIANHWKRPFPWGCYYSMVQYIDCASYSRIQSCPPTNTMKPGATEPPMPGRWVGMSTSSAEAIKMHKTLGLSYSLIDTDCTLNLELIREVSAWCLISTRGEVICLQDSVRVNES